MNLTKRLAKRFRAAGFVGPDAADKAAAITLDVMRVAVLEHPFEALAELGVCPIDAEQVFAETPWFRVSDEYRSRS